MSEKVFPLFHSCILFYLNDKITFTTITKYVKLQRWMSIIPYKNKNYLRFHLRDNTTGRTRSIIMITWGSLLKNPIILSHRNEYKSSDLSEHGKKNFFTSHPSLLHRKNSVSTSSRVTETLDFGPLLITVVSPTPEHLSHYLDPLKKVPPVLHHIRALSSSRT